MMNTLYRLAIVLVMLLFRYSASGQAVANAELDTTDIMIGDQIQLHLSFSGPKNTMVVWPVIHDTIVTQIEVVKRPEIDTAFSKDGNKVFYKQDLTITGFDSGYFAIPPFEFKFKYIGDTAVNTVKTQPLLLGVHSLGVDPQKGFKDIKSPLEAPLTFMEVLPWILLAVAVILLAFFVIYYLKRRKQDRPVFVRHPKPKLPPHQVALNALEELRLKKLWQNGKTKQYYTELTDILRTYITEKFGIPAHEMTSDEIMEALQPEHINEQAFAKLRETFMLADLVKFAKAQPVPVENDMSLNNGIDFVKETILLNQTGSTEQDNSGSRQNEQVVKQEPIGPQPAKDTVTVNEGFNDDKELRDV